jgi:hypothetical protein
MATVAGGGGRANPNVGNVSARKAASDATRKLIPKKPSEMRSQQAIAQSGAHRTKTGYEDDPNVVGHLGPGTYIGTQKVKTTTTPRKPRIDTKGPGFNPNARLNPSQVTDVRGLPQGDYRPKYGPPVPKAKPSKPTPGPAPTPTRKR